MGRKSSNPIDLLKSSELSGTTSSWIGFPSAPNLHVDLVTSSESLPIDFCHNDHPLPIQDISVLKVVRADQLIASITIWRVIILRGSWTNSHNTAAASAGCTWKLNSQCISQPTVLTVITCSNGWPPTTPPSGVHHGQDEHFWEYPRRICFCIGDRFRPALDSSPFCNNTSIGIPCPLNLVSYWAIYSFWMTSCDLLLHIRGSHLEWYQLIT